MQKPEDQELLRLFSENPERAINLIFKQYYQPLFARIFRIIYDKQATEDLVQELFLSLWQKREEIHIQTSLKAYLFKMAVNRSLNYIRDSRKYRYVDEDSLFELHSDVPGAQELLDYQQLKQKIGEAIERLPPKCRLVFSLSRFEDMSYREIAEQLDISIKTVENQMLKALKVLRQSVRADDESGHRGEDG